MLKVIITKGLQGSGKSTWAKKFVEDNPNFKRVNKDDLRLMLDNSRWSKSNEKFVIELRNHIILETLKDGKSIIVDDTNLNPIHEEHIRALVKDIAEVEIKDFTNIPIEVCIENDLKRSNPVGEDIIRRTQKQWMKPKMTTKPEFIPNVKSVILCDLDGTLCLFDRDKRNPYDRDFENDELNTAVAMVISKFPDNIIFVSGRQEKFREQTLEFFIRHKIHGLQLFMRDNGDGRNDGVVKQEIYDNEIKGKYNVMFVLDDRNRTVKVWRDNGLTCFQVADGDF